MGFALAGPSTRWAGRDAPTGAGGGVFVGLQIGAVVSLEVNWNASWFRGDFATLIDLDAKGGEGTTRLMCWTGDLKLRLPTAARFAPYLRVGTGWATLSAHRAAGYQRIASGPVATFGLGLDLRLSRWVSLGGQLFYRSMWLVSRGASVADDQSVTYAGVGLAFDFSLRL